MTETSVKLLYSVFGMKSLPYKDIKVCELGNAHIINNALPYKTGKEWAAEIGIGEHISIDLNGEDGALAYDLSKPIIEFENYFDIVDSFGTAEHVEDQYVLFENIHNFMKAEGVLVGSVPDTSCYPDSDRIPKEGNVNWLTRYSRYRYEKRFFEHLAMECGYKIRYLELMKKNPNKKSDRHIIGFVLQKRWDVPFISKEIFAGIKGLYKRK